MSTAESKITARRVVLFDLDGTLSDSEAGILAGLRQALYAVELPVLADDVLRKAIGPPWEHGLPEIGVPDELVPELLAAYRAVYDDHGVYDTTLFDGVVAMLDRLVEQGWLMAVATSKPQRSAERVLDHLGLTNQFGAIGGAMYESGRRTKADVIAHVLDRLGIAGGPAAVMVGDRCYDVEGARAHGIDTIGAAWGYASPGELEQAGAWAIAPTPADVVEVVADRQLTARISTDGN